MKIGLDIGSTTTKCAVVDDGRVVDTILAPTGFSSVDAAERVARELTARGYRIDTTPVVDDERARTLAGKTESTARAERGETDAPGSSAPIEDAARKGQASCALGDGAQAPFIPVVATGYGRIAVPFSAKKVTEITCHGRGAVHLFGPEGTVIDVGGQDTKVIQLQDGKVKKFIMNDKCSAGTGKFLEIMANRMGISQEQLAALAAAGKPTAVSSMCTVFAESEVISLIGRGEPLPNIANGVIESVVGRVCTLANQVPGEHYFLTGGLCENDYIIDQMAKTLGAPVTSCPEARFAGAIGAALS